MSNQAKMTLEEKITQTIKSDTLMSLVGDEDAITELVERAIREALYQPVRIRKQYGGYEEKDSVVVHEARAVANAAAKSLTEKMVEKLLKDEVFVEQVQAAMLATIPHALMSGLVSGLQWQAQEAAQNAINQITPTF